MDVVLVEGSLQRYAWRGKNQRKLDTIEGHDGPLYVQRAPCGNNDSRWSSWARTLLLFMFMEGFTVIVIAGNVRL